MTQILNNCDLISVPIDPETEGADWLFSKMREDHPLPELDYSHSKYNNWIIQGHVIGGVFPGKDGINYKNDQDVEKNLRDIVESGVDTFVCLQMEVTAQNGECGSVDPHFRWAFPDFCNYSHYLKKMYPHREFTYIHYPITDNEVPSMDNLYFSLTKITELLSRGHRIFIHCAGGHGRTGIYGSILIGLIERCSAEEALRRNSLRHRKRANLDLRQKTVPPSPSTEKQREIVKNFLTHVGRNKIENRK